MQPLNQIGIVRRIGLEAVAVAKFPFDILALYRNLTNLAIGNFRQKFGLRWGMRIFTLIMLLPGCLPGVSAVAAPVLLAVHVWVYGRSARKHATELLEPTAA